MSTEAQIIANSRNAQKSTIWGKPLDQNKLFMQNKPNLNISKCRTSSLLLTTNDQRLTTRQTQNKPNQTQFHPHRLSTYFNFLLFDIVRPKLCRRDSKISLIPNTQITPNTDNLREWGLSRKVGVSK